MGKNFASSFRPKAVDIETSHKGQRERSARKRKLRRLRNERLNAEAKALGISVLELLHQKAKHTGKIAARNGSRLIHVPRNLAQANRHRM